MYNNCVNLIPDDLVALHKSDTCRQSNSSMREYHRLCITCNHGMEQYSQNTCKLPKFMSGHLRLRMRSVVVCSCSPFHKFESISVDYNLSVQLLVSYRVNTEGRLRSTILSTEALLCRPLCASYIWEVLSSVNADKMCFYLNGGIKCK
jgi:hypothetical protein